MAHVIVDLDGTLIDTRARHHAVYAEALGHFGAEPLAADVFWRAKRRGTSWPRLLGPAIPADAFLERFRARIEAPDVLALDRPQAGAAAALRALAARGLAAVLVTARHDRAALTDQLAGLGLEGAFAGLVLTGDGEKALPEPWRAALRWFGDTEADIRAARAAGVPVTAVANGIRGAALLARESPDDIAPSFAAAVRRLAAAASPR